MMFWRVTPVLSTEKKNRIYEFFLILFRIKKCPSGEYDKQAYQILLTLNH